MPDASIEKRCEEIEKNFSGAISMYNGGMIRRMSVFVFKFEPTYEQENQLKNGELIPVSPKKVQMQFTDGGHYSRYHDVALSCPIPFEIKCKNIQNTNAEKCDNYDVKYHDQVCIMQAKWMPYMFSDQQNQAINLDGEIRLSALSGSLFVVKGMRW